MPKTIRRLDSITSFRSRTPTNEQAAANFTNMCFDHSQQKAVVPGGVLGSKSAPTTMNAGGRPKALDAQVGGTRYGSRKD